MVQLIVTAYLSLDLIFCEDNTLTFNQGVTGSRPVRPTKLNRPPLPGGVEDNQGVKTLGQPTP